MAIRSSRWDKEYSDFIGKMRDKPFAWGEHDCCTFSAGLVMAITGEDPMPEFRGVYNSALTAKKALKSKSLDQVLSSKFNEVPIGRAQRGDLALFGDAVGVVAGSFAWFVGENGLERVNRGEWDKCWRVGDG